MGSGRTSVRYHFGSPFSSERLWFVDTVLWLCTSLPTETLKWLSSLPILMQESFWLWQCSDRYIISLFPHLYTPFHPFSQSLISLMVSVDVKHHVYLLTVTPHNSYWVFTFVSATRMWGVLVSEHFLQFTPGHPISASVRWPSCVRSAEQANHVDTRPPWRGVSIW